jgi:hypothetical protein
MLLVCFHLFWLLRVKGPGKSWITADLGASLFDSFLPPDWTYLSSPVFDYLFCVIVHMLNNCSDLYREIELFQHRHDQVVWNRTKCIRQINRFHDQVLVLSLCILQQLIQQYPMLALDASGLRSKPREWRLRQMTNNFHLYCFCSISSDAAGACTYRRDDIRFIYRQFNVISISKWINEMPRGKMGQRMNDLPDCTHRGFRNKWNRCERVLENLYPLNEYIISYCPQIHLILGWARFGRENKYLGKKNWYFLVFTDVEQRAIIKYLRFKRYKRKNSENEFHEMSGQEAYKLRWIPHWMHKFDCRRITLSNIWSPSRIFLNDIDS